MCRYFYENIEGVISDLYSDRAGLTEQESAKRLRKYGENVIRGEKKEPYWIKFLRQFTDLLAIILIVAAFLSFLLGSPKDGTIILIIVVLNATISFFQEFKAEKAID